MGQWLSIPMIIGGIVMLAWAYRPRKTGMQGAGGKQP
jgi:prolipoprotein diacylglyceryltransferase